MDYEILLVICATMVGLPFAIAGLVIHFREKRDAREAATEPAAQ